MGDFHSGWMISRRGNSWQKLPNATVTVFRQFDRKRDEWVWAFCIARSKGDVKFVSPFRSVETAKRAALREYHRKKKATAVRA